MSKMGFHMKWARSVEISGVIVASFLVLVYFYASATLDPFMTAHRGSEKIIVETSNALRDGHITLETTGKRITSTQTPPILSCDLTDFRTSVCEIYSNVRILSNSSSIVFTPDQTMNLEATKTLRIRPYTRKFDAGIMKNVKEVTIRPLFSSEEPPKCDIDHNIPAVLFASTGYTGNFFHAFSDVLLPLFITTRKFEGEVQFLTANMHLWFIDKYKKILDQLSNYEIIDFNKENKVQCYPHLIVGLYSHGELTMNPSRTPNNYTMVDFAKLLRRAYSLERDFAINLAKDNKKRPRLLIIARNHTRKITNIDEVVVGAEELGFEVLVKESSFVTDVGKFARIVNSFDVMIGVHGAGLANEVFLPTNAVVIQIVPFGNLEWIAEHDFAHAARDMMLRYIQYSISEYESTLIDLYPRDDAVFRDPKLIHGKGWDVMGKIYLQQQSVRLNMTRFKPVLTTALELLR